MSAEAPQQRDNSAADAFFGGALRRIANMIAIFSLVGLVAFAVAAGWTAALGFAAGAFLAAINFYLLKRSVQAVGDRIVNEESTERGGLIVAGFLMRYVLIGIAAYVIFRGSVQGLYGFLVGLVLPIAAASCEAAYELYVALRRGL